MTGLVRAAEVLGRWTSRWVPSAFSIAVLLTALSFVLALTWGGQPLPKVLGGWGDGFWELLSFSMQMALVMFTGYLLALTHPVRRLLEAVADLARTPRTAVALMAFTSMALAYLNWGLSIVASAMLVRFVVRRQPAVDYRLVVAAAYFGLGATWHAGMSASAPLLVATPKHFLEGTMGVVPLDRTLFSGFNLGLVAGVMVVLTAFAYLLHPAPASTVPVDPALLERLHVFRPPERPATLTFANFLDHGGALNLLFGVAGVIYLGRHLMLSALDPDTARALASASTGEAARLLATDGLAALALRGFRHLNLNTVNFAFLTAAVLLHRTPAALLKASEEAATVLSGIVLQFPLYAGIYGVFKAGGLTEKLGDLFVQVATPGTFPALVYVYSGIVNYFVPSGGSKWAIEAPYLLEAASRLSVPPEKVVLAYAWGDMATDLIQPFWALPLLAVAKLEFKDVLGFLLLVFLLYAPAVTLAMLLYGAV